MSHTTWLKATKQITEMVWFTLIHLAHLTFLSKFNIINWLIILKIMSLALTSPWDLDSFFQLLHNISIWMSNKYFIFSMPNIELFMAPI